MATTADGVRKKTGGRRKEKEGAKDEYRKRRDHLIPPRPSGTFIPCNAALPSPSSLLPLRRPLSSELGIMIELVTTRVCAVRVAVTLFPSHSVDRTSCSPDLDGRPSSTFDLPRISIRLMDFQAGSRTSLLLPPLQPLLPSLDSSWESTETFPPSLSTVRIHSHRDYDRQRRRGGGGG